MLVVTKSLCGFLSNQVQFNMEICSIFRIELLYNNNNNNNNNK